MTDTKKYKRSWGTVVCWGSLEETATIMVDYKRKMVLDHEDDEVRDLVMDCYDPEIHGKTFPEIINWFYKNGVLPVQISSDL